MEEEEIPLKEFDSKLRNKEEDEDKSDLEDCDLEKVVATDFPDKEEEETASRDWGTVEEDQADEDSLEEVVTIPSKIVDKEDGNGNLKKVKVRDIVKDSLGELKNISPTQECDIPSDSSDVSLEEVCTIPNFIVNEEKWATADEESEDEEKGVEGRNMRARVISKTPSHESNMSDSSEVSLNETCTTPPNFIDEKETKKGQEKSKNGMNESVQKPPPTQDVRSSSDSSEISLEEIPSNFIDEEEEESHKDDFRNQNLKTVEKEEVFDEESDEENVIRFPPEEEIEAMDEIPLDEAEVDEPIIEERGPILSFSAAIRLIVAVRRLRKKCKVNSFAWAFQLLHVALNLGYYFFVVPFKIVLEQSGKFKIHVNPWQMAISIFVLLLILIRQVCFTNAQIKLTSVQSPIYILFSTENVLGTFMIVAYLFIMFKKRERINAIFENFNLQMAASFRDYEGRKYKLILLILSLMLIYMGVANWRAWGNAIYNSGWDKGWTKMFIYKVEIFLLPINNDPSNLYFVVVLIVTTFAEICFNFLHFFMSVLMWSASIAVFNVLRQADHLFGQKGSFNLTKDSSLFKVIVEMVKKVSAMIGPVIVMFCLEVIPYTIYVIYWISQANLNSTNGWILLFEVFIKLGHIFIACSASSNGSKLVNKIDEQIDREPAEILQIKGKMQILRKMQWNELINEFEKMTAQPMSITGMELFVINVQFLGAVTLAVLTNGLLFAQWIRDTEKSEPECTCICPIVNATFF